MSQAIPSLKLDTDHLPEPERFASWSEALATYDVAPLGPEGAAAFRAKLTAWSLGELVVTRGRLTPVRFVRSARKAKSDGHDSFVFLLLNNGSWTGEVEGRGLTIGPGQVATLDLSRPFWTEATDNAHVTVGVSRRALQATLPTVPDLHGRVLDGAPGRLVADHLVSLARHLPSVTAADVPPLTKATLGLLTGALASLPQVSAGPARGSALRHRARRHIDLNLTAAALSPDHLCRELAVSRSSLNRAFTGAGGVAAYILGRRLEAVHARLAHPDEHRTVGEIARRFQFVSAAHFSNAFRARFNYSPSEARAFGDSVESKASTAVRDETAATQFRAWMTGLTSP